MIGDQYSSQLSPALYMSEHQQSSIYKDSTHQSQLHLHHNHDNCNTTQYTDAHHPITILNLQVSSTLCCSVYEWAAAEQHIERMHPPITIASTPPSPTIIHHQWQLHQYHQSTIIHHYNCTTTPYTEPHYPITILNLQVRAAKCQLLWRQPSSSEVRSHISCVCVCVCACACMWVCLCLYLSTLVRECACIWVRLCATQAVFGLSACRPLPRAFVPSSKQTALLLDDDDATMDDANDGDGNDDDANDD